MMSSSKYLGIQVAGSIPAPATKKLLKKVASLKLKAYI